MEKKPDLIKFLLGIEDYNGLWFGDIDNNGQRFWWRTLLKEEFDSLQSQLSEAEKRIKQLEADLHVANEEVESLDLAENEWFESESKLQSENERLLSALKELHKESYDLREHCQDRGYLDFNEPDNDGVVQFNAALENANQILNNTKSDGDAFLLHLIDVTACFVMEQNMFLATPTRKELIDKARSTFKQSN